MFERFTHEAKSTVRRAAELAEVEGAAMVEAEHLLMALVEPGDPVVDPARDPDVDPVRRVLLDAGVTVDAIRRARDAEFRAALANVGVTTDRPAPAGSKRLRRGRTTRFGQSAKLALERTVEIAATSGERHIGNASLLLAITSASAGTTPQLFVQMNTSPEQLRAALRAVEPTA